MKTAVLLEPNRIEIQDRARPEPGPDEVLIAVRAVGICGSDTHYFAGWRDHEPDTVYPFVLGHEFSGEVAALGENVTGIEPGRPVCCAPELPCGECEWCRRGERNVCPNVRFCASGGFPGCLSEYYVIHKSQVHPLPEGLGFAEATLAEPLAIGLHVVDNLVRPAGGETYGIIGAGPIGLVTTFAAARRDASAIYVAEKRAERADAALHMGADKTCLVPNADFEELIRSETDGRGVDVAVEAAGELDAVAQVLRLARIHGIAVIEGIPPAGEAAVAIDAARRRELTVIFGRRSVGKTDEALGLIASGQFDARLMITHHFPLTEAQAAFECARDYKDGAIKIVIEA